MAVVSANAAASNVSLTAAATEELSVTGAEIHGRATEGAGMAHRALTDADRTNQSVAALSAAVETIGSVVDLISSIASQTNLLALNATIEAARAGAAVGRAEGTAKRVLTLSDELARRTADLDKAVELLFTSASKQVKVTGFAELADSSSVAAIRARRAAGA